MQNIYTDMTLGRKVRRTPGFWKKKSWVFLFVNISVSWFFLDVKIMIGDLDPNPTFIFAKILVYGAPSDRASYVLFGPKIRRKYFTSQKTSLSEVSKKLFLTNEIDSWLLRSINFLESTKTALNCHTIISTVRVLLSFIPKASINSKKHTRYAWCTQKMLRKHFASQNKSPVDFKKLILRRSQESISVVKKTFLKPRKGLCFGS